MSWNAAGPHACVHPQCVTAVASSQPLHLFIVSRYKPPLDALTFLTYFCFPCLSSVATFHQRHSELS